jgi:hypothetical protein
MNPQNPQTRQVWNITDLEVGTFSNDDAGQATIGVKVASGEIIPWGIFVNRDSAGKMINVAVDSAKVSGIAMVANQVINYEDKQYQENEIAELSRRGYVVVKIDPNNVPVAFGPIRVSYATGKVGWLTSSETESFLIGASEGISIERVSTEIAEVYFPGHPSYVVGGAPLSSQSFAGLKTIVVVAGNISGPPAPTTATGALVGERVIAIVGNADAGGPPVVATFGASGGAEDFADIIEVDDEILQNDGDLSANTYTVWLAPALS